MKKKLSLLIGVIVLVLIVAFLIRLLLVNRMPRQGVLKVSSNIPARVLLDNRDIGKTPLEEKVQAGEYSLRLVPDTAVKTLSAWQGTVRILESTLSYINRDLAETELTSAGDELWLEKISGKGSELSILSVPDGANVLVNDVSRGVTPVTIADLPPGEHTLVVSSPGFEPRSIKAKLTAGYKVVASVYLAISPSQIANPVIEMLPVASGASTLVAPTSLVKPTSAITPTSKPTPTAVANKIVTPTTTVARNREEKVVVLDTPTGFLRVRSSPGGEEIGRVEPGDEFVLLSQESTWFKIQFSTDTVGWISSQYAEKLTE